MTALASPFAPFTGVGGGDPFGGLTAFGFTIPQGSPAEIEAGARQCLDRAFELTTQAGSIEQGARIALGDWHGGAQAAFAACAGHASSALHANADAFINASTALDRLAVELQRAQDITQRAAAECATCQERLTSAEQDANHYTQDAQNLSQQAALTPHPHTQAALNHQAIVAADQAHAAQADANRARDQLDLAEQQGRNADQAYQEQAAQIRGQIGAAQADIRAIPRLPAGAPIPITITSADISLGTRMLRGAGNLAAAAQAAANPAKLRRLGSGHLTPAAAAAFLRTLHIAEENAPGPQRGSLLDAAGGFVNAVTLGAISFGNPNTARYRGGEDAAMIPIDPESLIVDGDRIAAAVAEDGGKAAAEGAGRSLEGATGHVVVDPADRGRTITDIDRIENGTLWEKKSTSIAPYPEQWVEKHVVTKFHAYLDARQYLPGYENAPIGFHFTSSNLDAALRAHIETAMKTLRASHPDVTLLVRWSQ